eukprot:5584454-Amphidinium_carterae.1
MANVLQALSEHEASHVLADRESVVVPARLPDVFKQVEERDAPSFSPSPQIPRGLVHKSRLILQGVHEKDLLALNHSIAAGEFHVLRFVLQVLADQQRKGFGGHPVYVLLPREGVPTLKGVKVAKFAVEGYGLTTGPLSWRNTLYSTKGIQQHPLGPCTLLSYNQNTKRLQGILLSQVDDVLGGGVGLERNKTISELRSAYDFGKWKPLTEGVEFNGRCVQEKIKEDGMTLSMEAYVQKIR